MIPTLSSSSSASGGRGVCGMRQLSAAEERKIDDALRLASSFARLSTCSPHDVVPLTPTRLLMSSGSSRESLDSPAPAAGTSSASVFRFAGLRRRRESCAESKQQQQRTFLDGLSVTCNATDIVTPDAQVPRRLSACPPVRLSHARSSGTYRCVTSDTHRRPASCYYDASAYKRCIKQCCDSSVCPPVCVVPLAPLKL